MTAIAPAPEAVERVLAAGFRFYVAWHPDRTTAFLRWKDADRLADWRSRRGEHLPGAPTIVDVTEQIKTWLAAPHPLFCPQHAALGREHADCRGTKCVDSDWTPGSFCWVGLNDLERCRAFAATNEEETAHTAATGHDDWLVVLPHAEPFPNVGPRVRKRLGRAP